MEYQCSYDDIEKGICYFLTINKGQKFTSEQILNKLLEKKICLELDSSSESKSEFENKCDNASKIFSKIKKIGNYYLFIEKHLDIEIIKNIALFPSDYPTISFDSILPEGDTILHVLCANGCYDCINNVSKSISIDPTIKNENGKTLYDVIPFTQNGYQTFKTLFDILSKQIVKTETLLKSTRELNMSLTSKNINLLNSEMSYKQKMSLQSKLKFTSNMLFFQTILCVVLLSYIAYNLNIFI